MIGRFSFLAAMVALAAPLQAAPAVSARDISSVVRALGDAGVPAAIKRDDDGIIYVLGDEGGSAEFTVNFADCDDDEAKTGCKLLMFDTVWEPADFIDADLVNRFNRKATLGHAFLDEEGALHLALSVTTVASLDGDNFRDVLAWWDDADADLRDLIGDADPGIPVIGGGGSTRVVAR